MPAKTELLAILLLGGLAGCAHSGSVQTSSSLATKPLEDAFVVPPPGGPAMVDVEQRQYSNGVQQTIALAGFSPVPGQNYIRVRVLGTMNSNAQDALPNEFGGPTDISREMRAAFPTVRMARSSFYVQNRYGPFGYATGSARSTVCLYGWQLIRANASLFADRGAIDIRVRLCESGKSEQQLLAVMYGYTVNAFASQGSWNPYGNAPSPSKNFGKGGAEMFPSKPSGADTMPAFEAPHDVSRRPSRLPATRRSAAEAPKSEAPIGPIVPPPPVPDSSTTVPAPPATNEQK